MALFRMPRFIRRFIRRRMHPMAEEQAWLVKHKIAILYSIIAWHAAGFVLYQILVKGNKNWPINEGIRSTNEDLARPALQWAHSLGIQKAQVYRIKKFDINSISEAEDIDLSNMTKPAAPNVTSQHVNQEL